MGAATAIQWTDATYNPWRGCKKVSDGCANCYMFDGQRRYGRDPEVVVRCSPSTFNAPLRWQKELEKAGGRKLVFTCSWSDFFHRAADDWRMEAWAIMSRCPNLTFQVLTKRPDRAVAWYERHGWLPNVWLGTTVESQKFVSRLDAIALVDAPVHFVSCEPLLGPLAIKPYLYACNCSDTPCTCKGLAINWVICGGESGPHARPMHPDWARGLRDQCQAAGVAFFFKQWGEWVEADHPAHGTHWDYVGSDKFAMKHVGKARAGATLDGREWREMPQSPEARP